MSNTHNSKDYLIPKETTSSNTYLDGELINGTKRLQQSDWLVRLSISRPFKAIALSFVKYRFFTVFFFVCLFSFSQ